MDKLDKIKKNWFDFGMSFLFLADLACSEMRKEKNAEFYSAELYIATIYNIKHGIEVNLKSLIVLLEEKEILKKLEHHNQEEILNELHRLIGENKIMALVKKLTEKHKNDENWVFKKGENIDLIMLDMVKLVSKYHKCDFLKDKIGTDFIIEDTSNTAFKYPQNSLLIKLDYEKIIKKNWKRRYYKNSV